MSPSFQIRPIEPRDDAAMAAIIREVMPEFGADGPGFAIHDEEVDGMAEAYARQDTAYYVVIMDGEVAGGAGIAPLADATEKGVCELRKMYFLPKARGIGAGAAMMRCCLEAARRMGYKRCYLETLPGMDSAQTLYRRHGFEPLDHAMGGTGHFGCDRFFIRDL